jgi:hypothetical protein
VGSVQYLVGQTHRGEDQPDLPAREHADSNNTAIDPLAERAQAGHELANDSGSKQSASEEEDGTSMGIKRIELVEVDRCANQHKENGDEQVGHWLNRLTDVGVMLGPGKHEAGSEGPDQGGYLETICEIPEEERKGHGGHNQPATCPHPVHKPAKEVRVPNPNDDT